MLERMIELLRGVTKQVKIVAVPGKYVAFGVEVIEDRWPGEGPLGGIITGLEDSATNAERHEWNLIVSCDMPFLTSDWLRFLSERAAKSNAQGLLPHSGSGPKPPLCFWQTRCAPRLRCCFPRRRRNRGRASAAPPFAA